MSGFRYYRGSPISDDKRLRELYVDRIYDARIDEEQLRICDNTAKKIADGLDKRLCSSRELIRGMGRFLKTGVRKAGEQAFQTRGSGSVRMTGMDDRRHRTEDGRTPRVFSVAWLLSSVVCLLVLPVGCRNRALEQAQQDAREAKANLNKLNYQLKTLEEKIATKEAELFAVQQSREEMEKRVGQLQQERDQTATFAQQAQEAITRLTTQSSSRTDMTAALEKQVAELKSLVEEQQKLIEQLQKGPAAQPAGGTKASPPAEPNQPEPGTGRPSSPPIAPSPAAPAQP